MSEQEQNLIFQQWLQQYKPLLFKIVRAYAFTAMDVDDLFQEISFQVWRSIPSFRRESAVSTWLYRIALNTSISWSTKERKFREPPTDVVLSQSESVLPGERLTWLYNEIHKLDEVDRSLTLLLLDGFSYKEMSAMLGITESNVGVKINRIKKYLSGQIKKTYDYGV